MTDWFTESDTNKQELIHLWQQNKTTMSIKKETMWAVIRDLHAR